MVPCDSVVKIIIAISVSKNQEKNDSAGAVERQPILYCPLTEAFERREKLCPNRRVRVSQMYRDDNGLLCYV